MTPTLEYKKVFFYRCSFIPPLKTAFSSLPFPLLLAISILLKISKRPLSTFTLRFSVYIFIFKTLKVQSALSVSAKISILFFITTLIWITEISSEIFRLSANISSVPFPSLSTAFSFILTYTKKTFISAKFQTSSIPEINNGPSLFFVRSLFSRTSINTPDIKTFKFSLQEVNVPWTLPLSIFPSSL